MKQYVTNVSVTCTHIPGLSNLIQTQIKGEKEREYCHLCVVFAFAFAFLCGNVSTYTRQGS